MTTQQHTELESLILKTLRDVPDFPKPGIIFKDIAPVLSNSQVFQSVIDGLIDIIKPYGVTCIAGIEARGFLFGAPIAYSMGLPFVPVRKPGKLPWKTKSKSYTLEYGEATIEIHEDAFEAIEGEKKVALIDDLLATGGTTKAACELIESVGGKVAVAAFVVELGFLPGRNILKPHTEVKSLSIVN
jgi:adenine phosphoribosyltransferase